MPTTHHQTSLAYPSSTVEEIGKKLSDGSYEKEHLRQSFVYKNFENFRRKKGVCYVPELSDEEYSYQDFVELCGGNEELAEYVFEVIDWQHPESLIDGDLREIGILACEDCGYLYDTMKWDNCPKCDE